MSALTPPRHARGPKAPAAVHAATALVLLLVVGVVALDSSQAPPPRIAEFAPQSVEQITESQQGQSASGPGGGRAPGSTPTPEEIAAAGGKLDELAGPTPAPVTVPRSRRCYGNPPRQTEDPQSPPCVPYWDPKQDNGGATAPGVTADEIVVAWPFSLEKVGDTERLAKHFNLRYEFYGRKIKLVNYQPRGGVFGGFQASDMQASAVDVHERIKAFASLAYPPKSGAEHHYYDALAARGILGIDSHASNRTEADYTANAPYEWNYLPAFDTMMRNYAEWICKSLAGRRPQYGGTGTAELTSPRVFGLVYFKSADGSIADRSILTSALRNGCGVVPAAELELTTGQQTILKLQEAKVTSIICLCQGGHYFDSLMPAATQQVYFPEWLVSSYHYLDYDGVGQKFPAEHAEHAFGLTFHNKWLPQKDMPWYQAIKEADPAYETGDDGYASAAYERYYELLLLASGIQMAGPNLTAQSFQSGLFKAKFPAPGSGDAPLYAVGGGFGPGNHTMSEDAATIWYSASGESYTTNVRRGTFCYIRSGKRYALGQWPREDPPLFREPCK
ncbi:MAG TPA: hypothetical protein VNE62_06810 [Actinomycetota bacterium]|nr:hypothetical protein [Actinomycetota bacterium]